MNVAIHSSSVGFLLFLAIASVNVTHQSEHSRQHVTPSMASMANIKDNKTSLEEGKSDPISIFISPIPTWSSTWPSSQQQQSLANSVTITSNRTPPSPSSTSTTLFGSTMIKTSTLSTPHKESKAEDRHTRYFRVSYNSSRKIGGRPSTTSPTTAERVPQEKGSFSSRETITEVKRSVDEFEFQLEPPGSPRTLASSSTRITGPYFESNKTITHLTARAGQTVLLDCAVVLLQGRTVSWLRRRKESLQLLTVGNATYYSDSRVGIRFRYPNNWRLGIDMVQKGDEGEYQCQLSTHPPKALIFRLKVIAPAVQILDENGHTVNERHYKVDSSLHLTCKASHVDKSLDNVVWLKGDRPLPGGDSRIKVKLNKNQGGGEATGYLSVLSLRKSDSGNYSCRDMSSMASSTISVHVLNGEYPEAVQHENSANTRIPLAGDARHSLLLWVLASLSPLLISPLLFPVETTALHMGFPCQAGFNPSPLF